MLYLSIEISMYDPNDASIMQEMIDAMPENFVGAIGMNNVGPGLIGFLSSLFYGFIVFIFPMIYTIILCQRLVVKMVDEGSFAYLISTPNTRGKIIFTQWLYLTISILILFLFLFVSGVFISNMMFPDSLDINLFLSINITSMLISMVVGMISFFFSCLFSETKKSLALGGGIPVLLLIIYMLGNSTKNATSIKKLSIYNLLDTQSIIDGNSTIFLNLCLIVACIILLIASIYIFKRKRLSI